VISANAREWLAAVVAVRRLDPHDPALLDAIERADRLADGLSEEEMADIFANLDEVIAEAGL
jgi:hypothetical protein